MQRAMRNECEPSAEEVREVLRLNGAFSDHENMPMVGLVNSADS